MSNRPPPWVDPLMRFGYAARGFVYIIVGALAFVASVDGGRTPDSTLMQQPLGRWLVALAGVVAIALGVQHFVKAFREKYKENIRYTEIAQRLDPLLKLGLIAHGVVVVLVGIFFIWAAWTADASRAGGMRDALLVVRNADASQTLFTALGLGLLGFAAYCFVEAAFRIVPRCAPPDLQTLATRARALLTR